MQTKKLVLTLIACCCLSAVFAQYRGRDSKGAIGAPNISLDLGGPAVLYSLNFDRRFSQTDNGLGFRIGIGGAGGRDGGYFALPGQLNYLIGHNTRGNYFELGAGATYFHLSREFFFNDDPESTVAGNLTIGYRKQPFEKDGILFRVAFTPIIADGGFFPYGGISFGYRF